MFPALVFIFNRKSTTLGNGNVCATASPAWFFFFVNVIYSNACKCTWLPYAHDCVPVAKVALEMLMKLSHTDNEKHNETMHGQRGAAAEVH